MEDRAEWTPHFVPSSGTPAGGQLTSEFKSMLALSITSILVLIGVSLLAAWRWSVWMPGRSYRGILPPLDDTAKALREKLQDDLTVLAGEIGPRNLATSYQRLEAAAQFIQRSLQDAGFNVWRQEFAVDRRPVCNLVVECVGKVRPDQIIVVGAHYDTVPHSPGANDNGSGVVAALTLARSFVDRSVGRTVRFAFFVNEEAPYYMTAAMGSLQYAQECRANHNDILGMISLETIGYYVAEPATQRYPLKLLSRFYPSTGDFAAIVGNVRSRRFVHAVIRAMRKTRFPVEGIAAPSWLKDIFRSDHAAFWSCGFPALMITDTANFRYPHYHTAEDTVDKINFTALAALVAALTKALDDLATV
jgi:hypothetical protein